MSEKIPPEKKVEDEVSDALIATREAAAKLANPEAYQRKVEADAAEKKTSEMVMEEVLPKLQQTEAEMLAKIYDLRKAGRLAGKIKTLPLKPLRASGEKNDTSAPDSRIEPHDSRSDEEILFTMAGDKDIGKVETVSDLDTLESGNGTPAEEKRFSEDSEPIDSIESLANEKENAIPGQLPDGWKTPAELRDELRGLVGKLVGKSKEKFGTSERAKGLQEHLAARSEELDIEVEKIGGVEKLFRKMGEKYNKLGWKSKLAVGIGLGVGSGVFAAVSLPEVAAIALAGIAAQRVAGLAGMFLKYENTTQDGKWKKEKAMGKAIAYTAAMTGAMLLLSEGIKEGVEYANQHQWGDVIKEWTPKWLGDMLGHHAPAHEAPVQTHIAPKMPEDVPQPAAAAAAGEVAAATSPTPEVVPAMPTVQASAHGYEGMMKELISKLPENPGHVPPGSDLEKLYEARANPGSIDTVVHQMASDTQHNAFHGGMSVHIDSHAQMTIGDHGELHLSTEQYDYTKIPDHAPVTHDVPVALHPEAATASAGAPPVSSEAIDLFNGTQPTTPTEVPVYAPDTQAPAPVETSTPHPVAPASAEVPAVHPAPSPEVLPTLAPASLVEHAKEFLNANKVPIDPLHGHVFQDAGGKIFAYGNNFDSRFEAAQEFAQAHPGVSVFVQAEEPALDRATNTLHQWVQEIIYEKGIFGIGGGMRMNPEPTGPDQIFNVNPDSFIKPAQ